MDIGKEGKPIIVEPLRTPIPQREPAPARRSVPRREPAEQPSRPVKVPEKVPAKR
jgi:hypothetical protein